MFYASGQNLTFFNRRYHLDEHVKDSFYVVGIFPSCKEGCSHYSLLQKLINNFLFGISPFFVWDAIDVVSLV